MDLAELFIKLLRKTVIKCIPKAASKNIDPDSNMGDVIGIAALILLICLAVFVYKQGYIQEITFVLEYWGIIKP